MELESKEYKGQTNMRAKLFLISSITLLLLVLFGCAIAPIAVKKIVEEHSINSGESILLEWEFEGADRVRVSGVDGVFSIKDTLTVAPLYSTKYRITAYQGNVDSIVVFTVVNVLDPLKAEGIQRGPQADIIDTEPTPERVVRETKSETITTEITTFRDDFSQITTNDYFNGIVELESTPVQLKIMRTLYPQSFDESVVLRAIVLDEQGSYVPNLESNRSYNWNSQLTCGITTKFRILDNIIQKFDKFENEDISMAVLLDNSASAKNNNQIVLQIENYLRGLNTNDRFSFHYFNQTPKTAISSTTIKDAYGQIKNYSLPQAVGLNSIFRAAYTTIRELASQSTNKKAMIIITHHLDNSSIIYTANDLVDLARKNNIPVYIIGIGDAINSYFLRYLTEASGGRYYHLFNEELGHLPRILLEIGFSLRNYYEINLNLSSESLECTNLDVLLKLNYLNLQEFREQSKVHFNQTQQYSQYQAIAIFDEGQVAVQPQYLRNVNSLIKVLKENPNTKIQLVGHSSNEGIRDHNEKISNERAESIREFMVKSGVKPEQISVKGIGNSLPLYFMPKEQWQDNYNRRVEIRWLDPDLLPFEIIAELTNNEEQAIRSIDLWEKRNYRAYFDRFLQNDIPYYRIKLWGFRTLEEAQQVAHSLESQYKTKFVVE